MKEKTIATFTQKNYRLQLLELTFTANEFYYFDEKKVCKQTKWQVRLNRKIIDTSISEYTMRKLFAMYVQNIILQLKIY